MRRIVRSTSPVDDPPIMLVRIRAGLVGETRRSCHLVAVPDTDAIPEHLTAYCGTLIPRGWAELLPAPAGMPCVLCIARAPLPGVDAPPEIGQSGAS